MVVQIQEHSGLLDQAASLSLQGHLRLAARYPWIPARQAEDFKVRIEWMIREGDVFGFAEDGALSAFGGYFPLENFRNAGAGAYTPDWCTGFSDSLGIEKQAQLQREIIKTMLERCTDKGIRLHGISVPASEERFRELLFLSGYGGIVMDAAKPLSVLRQTVNGRIAQNTQSREIRVRRAGEADSKLLESLNAALAAHIGASPVLMPNPAGMTAAEWKVWLGEKSHAAFLAWDNDRPVGFIKAEGPQFDVSYTVHAPDTMGINGMFVAQEYRNRGVASALLSALCAEAEEMEHTRVSVDCETTNPEAYEFWTRYFDPVSWSLERRF